MDEKITQLLEKLNEHMTDYYDSLLASGTHDKNFCDAMKEQNFYTATQGRKYTKILSRGSVVAFIDNDLNVYKPASWKAPAKHVRGNLNESPTSGFDLAGMGQAFVHYLRF